MKVLHAEISEGTRNKRTRRTTGLIGCVLTFESSKHIEIDSVVRVSVNEKTYDFRVAEISTTNSDFLELCAVEVGYWATKITELVDFDLRGLLNLSIEVVTDSDELRRISNASSFT